MAKKQTFGDKVGKGKKSLHDINFFGTRQDMVVKEILEDEVVVKVVAKDDKGLYVTYPDHIDTGLADPYRFGSDRTEPTGFEDEIEKVAE
jgi:hypothetical protein